MRVRQCRVRGMIRIAHLREKAMRVRAVVMLLTRKEMSPKGRKEVVGDAKGLRKLKGSQRASQRI